MVEELKNFPVRARNSSTVMPMSPNATGSTTGNNSEYCLAHCKIMDSNPSEPSILLARIIRFLIIFTTTLLAATWFVCATWNHFLENCFYAAWQIVLQTLNLSLRGHDGYGAALFKLLAALRLSNFGNLARSLELLLFRGNRDAGLLSAAATWGVVSY